MKKVLFVFRGESQKRILEQYDTHLVPRDFLYGMDLIDNKKFRIEYVIAKRGIRRTWIQKLCYLFEIRFARIVKLGLPIDVFLTFPNKFRNQDIIVCINDGISFGVLFWKRLGFIKGQVVVLMQSLPERTKYFHNNRLMNNFIAWMLKDAEVVMTLSKTAQSVLIKDYQVDTKKLRVFNFGIDKQFWQKTDETRNNFILSVGNDDNRDYRTLIKALPENIELVLVSKIKIDPMGKKVRQMSNISDLDLRDLYNQCQFAIIPSIKLNYESSGLSSSLQLAACQKALIISRAPTMEEVFEAGKDCLYYDPENVEDLKDKITTLWKNQELCLTLGLNAQNHAKAYDCENMAHQLESIISEI